MIDLWGISQQQQKLIISILKDSLKNFKSTKIFVFGSRARGDFRKYSDLDLWIESNPPVSSQELSQLREKFEDSDLPIKIDVLTPEICLEAYRDEIKRELKYWKIED